MVRARLLEPTSIAYKRLGSRTRGTCSARDLATGKPDILSVALDAGYNSHEAFTRAFQEQFDTTPRAVRDAQCFQSTKSRLLEPFEMNENLLTEIGAPRFEDGEAFRIMGLSERYNGSNIQAIPSQWQRFVPYLGSIRGQVGTVTFGVDSMDHCTGKQREYTAYGNRQGR